MRDYAKELGLKMARDYELDAHQIIRAQEWNEKHKINSFVERKICFLIDLAG